jgi:hypothetical protein
MSRKLEMLQSVTAVRVSPLAATKPGQVLQPLIGLIYFCFDCMAVCATWIDASTT